MLACGHTAWQKASRVETIWKWRVFQARQTTLASQLGSETSFGLRWTALTTPSALWACSGREQCLSLA